MDLMRIAEEIGKLVAEKDRAYGSSFSHTGEFLKILFPDGIKPERYSDVGLLVRVFDKQMRIAHRKGAFGESPWRDIGGYGICGQANQETEDAQKDIESFFGKNIDGTELWKAIHESQIKEKKLRFIDNKDGIVIDIQTGLMWERSPHERRYIWEDAQKYCKRLSLGGYADWRLPSKEELLSIVDENRKDLTIDPIFRCFSASYWSSTTGGDNMSIVWPVNFYNGHVYSINKSISCYVRAVRGEMK